MGHNLYFQIIIVFAVSVLGGWLALMRRWSDSLLHLFVSLGAGIILGVVFLHLLPESMLGGGDGAALPILIGFLLIFFLEKILLGGETGYDHSHKVISITVLLGLSVHSLFEGVGMAVGTADQNVGISIFVSVLTHKLPAAFALGSLLVLGRFSRKRIWSFLILFSLAAPAGALIFHPILSTANDSTVRALTGLTAGTFLYIATGDLLPEVFHTRESRWLKLLLLIFGVIFTLSFRQFHAH